MYSNTKLETEVINLLKDIEFLMVTNSAKQFETPS
jgi:hypothetical protein